MKTLENPAMLTEQPFVIRTSSGLLVGREEARLLRESVFKRLEEIPHGASLPLSLGAIQFLDFSAADELITKMVKRVSTGDLSSKHLFLVDLNDLVRENVQAALEIQQLACVHRRDRQTPEVLGKVSPELVETYELALRHGRITARDLVGSSCKTISAASNRLSRLTELGLIARTTTEAVESGGRQHVYEPIR
jgi:hypothetical protein